MIEQIEAAVRQTRERMMDEVPQNPDVLRMLEILSDELTSANGLPRDPRFAGSPNG